MSAEELSEKMFHAEMLFKFRRCILSFKVYLYQYVMNQLHHLSKLHAFALLVIEYMYT
jgi:hypothetical protein